MNNSMQIILIMIVAFLILGCSCSCRGMKKEYFTENNKCLKKIKYDHPESFYIGETNDKGQPHGKGIYYTRSTYMPSLWEGEWENENRIKKTFSFIGRIRKTKKPIYASQKLSYNNDGTIDGKIVLQNGVLYTGKIKNNAFHGGGTLTTPQGDTYSGNWEKNYLYLSADKKYVNGWGIYDANMKQLKSF